LLIINKFKILISILLIAITGLLIYVAFFKTPKSANLNVPGSSMPSDETQIAWIGPGLYYGYWFDSQDQYNNWYNNNYRNNSNRANPQNNPQRHSNDMNQDRGGMRDSGGRSGGGGRGR
jgi:uncharacterized membrane protein YgcG